MGNPNSHRYELLTHPKIPTRPSLLVARHAAKYSRQK
jgi:hypothetical protein